MSPEQSNLPGPAAPYWYGAPFLDAAIFSALAETVAASACWASSGSTAGPATAAAVRADTAPSRHRTPDMAVGALMRNPSSSACEG